MSLKKFEIEKYNTEVPLITGEIHSKDANANNLSFN